MRLAETVPYFILRYCFSAFVTVSERVNCFSCILFVTSSHNSQSMAKAMSRYCLDVFLFSSVSKGLLPLYKPKFLQGCGLSA